MFALYFLIASLLSRTPLQAIAFAGWDWRKLSSVLVTHSIMSALERMANWFMTTEFPEPLQTTLTRVLDKR